MSNSTSRRPPPPIPVSILTGFLGAGKTTLLNRLMNDESLAGALVLINEFGEIGLDHLFVEAIDRDMMLMASGCLCCTIRGELIDTLEDVLRRRDNGRMAPFDRILIETTGLADPAPIMHTFMQHPYLAMRFFPETLVTVVDAVNARATLAAHIEAVRQAAMADVLAITKTDLLAGGDVEALESLRGELMRLNPVARMIDVASAGINASALFAGSVYDPGGKTPDVAAWLGAEAIEIHAHSHASDHHHDINRHNASIQACCLRALEPLQPAQFELFIEMLRKVHGVHLLRLKGIVSLADDPHRPLVIHGVQHIFHPPVRLQSWPDEDRSSRVVCILHGLDPEHVQGLWRAFNGIPGIDQADGLAITSNPLNPSGGGLLG